MNRSPELTQLLEKYLKGICTAEETKVVEDWYANLYENFQGSADQVPAFDKMKLFKRIKQHADDFDHYEKPRNNKIFTLFTSKIALGAIAAMLILIIGINYLKPLLGTETNSAIAAKPDHIELNNITAAIVEHKLPDGSLVWLKPGSSLVYDKINKDAEREVKFSGEAFFEVAKDAAHPFIIQAEEMKIKVVGTSFNVIAIPASRTFKVLVVTGRVQVTARDKSGTANSVFLMPKQQASFNLNSQKIVQSLLTETQLKKQYWKPFTLNFSDDATMGMVAAELEKAFNVKVRFSNPDIVNCHLKVDFNNQQLPEIINYLEKLLDVTCEMTDGGTLEITGEGCAK